MVEQFFCFRDKPDALSYVSDTPIHPDRNEWSEIHL